jgi:hypothetical protein
MTLADCSPAFWVTSFAYPHKTIYLRPVRYHFLILFLFLQHIYILTFYGVATDDVLHARIQTMGVAEHSFSVNMHGKVVPWHIYDVGGARGQRHTWVPYFDDANAIIFVAPISAFDQVGDSPDSVRDASGARVLRETSIVIATSPLEHRFRERSGTCLWADTTYESTERISGRIHFVSKGCNSLFANVTLLFSISKKIRALTGSTTPLSCLLKYAAQTCSKIAISSCSSVCPSLH